MKNVALLMKLDMILHGKSIWHMKWQFLFFFCIFLSAILFAVHKPPKLFYIQYYNEDQSFGSKLAIDNFVKALSEVSDVKELDSFPETFEGDAFVYFPTGFAEKWQHFENFPAQITILSQNPIYQALLSESFQAYENIMLSSESVILAYNDELDKLALSSEKWINENLRISLDFLALAFQRNRFYSVKQLDTLPASLTKGYFYFSFSLFFGVLLSIYRNATEIERRKQYCRIFLSRITASEYIFTYLLSTLGFATAYVIALAGLAKAVGIRTNPLYYISFALVLVSVNLGLRLLVYCFQGEAEYIVVWVTTLFVLALFGGAFLPISFLPSQWTSLLHISPFYRIFLFLTCQATSEYSLTADLLWLGATVLLCVCNFLPTRRMQYV